MNEYPSAFLSRMQAMLGVEFSDFLECMEQPSIRGIRLNPIKCDEKKLKNGLDFKIELSPFSPYSYQIPEAAGKPGSIPLHHAGAFYSQEPSAASAVTILNPQPGEKILDLCAAPGGKSTQIAALLNSKGLLWSNEVVRSRATVLLSNMERMGVSNAVISSCHPETLCEKLAGYFDRILVDAPCSGEGMFRRDPQAVQDWSEEHVKTCAVRQGLILDSAANALRENGILVYSTCTFSPEENEETVKAFLERHPDFVLEDSGVSFGRPGIGMPQARRIFPMDGGDGHFVAKMRKASHTTCHISDYPYTKLTAENEVKSLYDQIFLAPVSGFFIQNGSSIIIAPQLTPALFGLGVIRAGVMLGEVQKGRIEPAHALFLSSSPQILRQTVDFSSHSAEIRAYLHGEELEVDSALKGYTGVAVDGVVTGFGKCSSARLKNRYPKGLRSHT
ncbi:MAG: RsmB/NOP family class I SAM-dependent RNA methyltransferase [Clostridium sp.]|uniref:RsmB/NOP family class I SAM-dependent RNA methyltransferase n=1 Tax=Clostridium sp. TaxID=1506 RepID=UPI00291166EB|nr:RsmB/NOP family class I SAM-dependent RNA methyltransferase [Clostridium sp.]MDU7337484.1 RsmB/NOP family class I SAM-dependent RNA methyltransferase [Clostridium sp.]